MKNPQFPLSCSMFSFCTLIPVRSESWMGLTVYLNVETVCTWMLASCSCWSFLRASCCCLCCSCRRCNSSCFWFSISSISLFLCSCCRNISCCCLCKSSCLFNSLCLQHLHTYIHIKFRKTENHPLHIPKTYRKFIMFIAFLIFKNCLNPPPPFKKDFHYNFKMGIFNLTIRLLLNMKLKSPTVKCTQKIRKRNFKQSEIKTDTVTPSLNKFLCWQYLQTMFILFIEYIYRQCLLYLERALRVFTVSPYWPHLILPLLLLFLSLLPYLFFPLLFHSLLFLFSSSNFLFFSSGLFKFLYNEHRMWMLCIFSINLLNIFIFSDLKIPFWNHFKTNICMCAIFKVTCNALWSPNKTILINHQHQII